MNEPEWQQGPFAGPAGSGSIIESADYAIARFRALRIPFPGDCRLLRARNHVLAVHEQRTDQPPDDVLAEATRTIFESYYIARALSLADGRPPDQIVDALARMLGGPDIPGDESDNTSRPRNTQFELFFGAWLVSGGVDVAFGEPDLIAHAMDQQLGIAAKRVRSRRQITRRFREAADQIRKRTGTGVVAVNVDHLLEAGDAPTDAKGLGEMFDRSVPEYDECMVIAQQDPAVKAFAAVGTRMAWDRSGKHPRLHIGLLFKWRYIPDDDADEQRHQEFWRQFHTIQRDRLARF